MDKLTDKLFYEDNEVIVDAILESPQASRIVIKELIKRVKELESRQNDVEPWAIRNITDKIPVGQLDMDAIMEQVQRRLSVSVSTNNY